MFSHIHHQLLQNPVNGYLLVFFYKVQFCFLKVFYKYFAMLVVKSGEHILFIFDEPTTGLHFHDIKKLLHSINALIDQGHTVIIIEHNTEVIKAADWVIDLGPEGGEKGGFVTFEGTPEALMETEDNYTGKYLRESFI